MKLNLSKILVAMVITLVSVNANANATDPRVSSSKIERWEDGSVTYRIPMIRRDDRLYPFVVNITMSNGRRAIAHDDNLAGILRILGCSKALKIKIMSPVFRQADSWPSDFNNTPSESLGNGAFILHSVMFNAAGQLINAGAFDFIAESIRCQ